MPVNGVYDLLKMLEIALDESYSIGKYTVVNKKEIEELIDKVYEALPAEFQEARLLLRDKERHIQEAQQRATRIIQEAQSEADRKLSESDQKKNLERECNRLKNEVIVDCEKIKHVALQDVESIRMQATEESVKMREGAEMYAGQILNNLEEHLTHLQQEVKNCQIYMEQLRNDTSARYANRETLNSRSLEVGGPRL